MLASFFPSLFYFPQMQRCLPQTATFEKSVQQSPFLSSTQVFTQWKESETHYSFGWIPDLMIKKKKFKTENVLQLKGGGRGRNRTPKPRRKKMSRERLICYLCTCSGAGGGLFPLGCAENWDRVALFCGCFARLTWDPPQWPEQGCQVPGICFQSWWKWFLKSVWVGVILFEMLWRVTAPPVNAPDSSASASFLVKTEPLSYGKSFVCTVTFLA